MTTANSPPTATMQPTNSIISSKSISVSSPGWAGGFRLDSPSLFQLLGAVDAVLAPLDEHAHTKSDEQQCHDERDTVAQFRHER